MTTGRINQIANVTSHGASRPNKGQLARAQDTRRRDAAPQRVLD